MVMVVILNKSNCGLKELKIKNEWDAFPISFKVVTPTPEYAWSLEDSEASHSTALEAGSISAIPPLSALYRSLLGF